MATRVAYPATESNGDTLTTTNFDKLPGGWIGYAEVTTAQTGISTDTALTGLTVTVTVNTSRRLQITAQCRTDQQTSNGFIKGRILEGATGVGQFSNTSLTSGSRQLTTGSCVRTPSAGSVTYSLNLGTSAGTVDMQCNTSDPPPAFILVTDIGPA